MPTCWGPAYSWLSFRLMETALQIATLAGVLLAVVSIFHAAHVNRRQMNARIFLEYTKRYESIIAGFPEGSLSFRLKQSGKPPAESDALRSAVLRYLNLCSEEYYLHKTRYLAADIWKIWVRELERTLRSPLLRREWPKLRPEFDAFSEFAEYVDRQQKQK